MNAKRLLIVLFFTGTAVSLLVWMGSLNDGHTATGWKWIWGLVASTCVGLTIWAFRLPDKTPDHLAELGLNYFEREGLCFAFMPSVANGQVLINVLYQNRYNQPCTAEILLRLSADSAGGGRDTAELRLPIQCAGAGFARESVSWNVSPEFANRKATCLIGADVNYPAGRGMLLRSRDGVQLGSVEQVQAPELLQLLTSSAKFEFTIPDEVARPHPPSTAQPLEAELPEALTQPITPIASAKSEVTVSGSRLMKMVCGKCSNAYEYTMRREASGSGEGADPTLAKKQAQAQAQVRLFRLLDKGCDVVPCPKCGSLTDKMREEKSSNRTGGIFLAICGCVIVAVGIGVCWIVYLINNSTGRLFYVVGIIGVVVVGFGIIVVCNGLFQLVTGGSSNIAGTNNARRGTASEHQMRSQDGCEEQINRSLWTCGGCGEQLEGQFSACWRCGSQRRT